MNPPRPTTTTTGEHTTSAALAALASEVERLSRQVAAQQDDLRQAQQTAEHAHRVLVDIVDRVQAIADQQPTATSPPAAGGGPSTGPVSWLTLEDPDQARTLLHQLADWLAQVYIHYPGATNSLGECWPWHPNVVEELLALKAAWHAAYDDPTAPPHRALDWHDRALPATIHHLNTTLGDCSQPAHQPGGRADRPPPTVPALDVLDQLADRRTEDRSRP